MVPYGAEPTTINPNSVDARVYYSDGTSQQAFVVKTTCTADPYQSQVVESQLVDSFGNKYVIRNDTMTGSQTISTTSTWNIWVDEYLGTSTTVTSSKIWPTWVESLGTTSTAVSYSTSTTNSINIWPRWVERQANRVIRAEQIMPPPRMTEEERRAAAEARRQEEERYRQRREEAEKQRRESQERAEVLLKAVLTPAQWDDYKKNKRFDIEVNGMRFRINKGRAGNVVLLDQHGKPKTRLCAHPRINCPDQDTMIAQKLMLETDPEGFMSLANHSRVYN